MTDSAARRTGVEIFADGSRSIATALLDGARRDHVILPAGLDVLPGERLVVEDDTGEQFPAIVATLLGAPVAMFVGKPNRRAMSVTLRRPRSP